jgi:hypothetical protein
MFIFFRISQKLLRTAAVVRDGKRSKRAPALVVHRDALAILAIQLFEKLVVLHLQRPARPGCNRIPIVGDWRAGFSPFSKSISVYESLNFTALDFLDLAV